jgi:hypothetical protein
VILPGQKLPEGKEGVKKLKLVFYFSHCGVPLKWKNNYW